MLLTHHLDECAWPDSRILREYRAQQVIEGHTGFRWLKDVALVAPIFLQLPTRIAALGLVFVLALMVRNYIQATIRAGLQVQGTSLPDRLDRPTQKPTMETAMRQLAAVVTTRVHIGDQFVEKRVQGLTDAGRQVLALLGLDEGFISSRRARENGRECVIGLEERGGMRKAWGARGGNKGAQRQAGEGEAVRPRCAPDPVGTRSGLALCSGGIEGYLQKGSAKARSDG